MAKIEFELKVDTTELQAALVKLGEAFADLQKATIKLSTVSKKQPFYLRFYNRIKQICIKYYKRTQRLNSAEK